MRFVSSIGKGFSRAQAEDAKLRMRELGDGIEKTKRMRIQKENELISSISICFEAIPKLCGEAAIVRRLFFPSSSWGLHLQ